MTWTPFVDDARSGRRSGAHLAARGADSASRHSSEDVRVHPGQVRRRITVAAVKVPDRNLHELREQGFTIVEGSSPKTS